MGVINDFLQYRKYKRENRKLVGLTEEVREEYSSNNKEQSVKKAIELIEENPDIAKGLLKKMIVDPEIPNQMIAEATQEIIKNSDETAGKIAGIEAVADIGEYVKDDTLSNIATEAGKTPEINRGLEINVLKQIDDKEKKQKGVEEILTRIYKNIARNKLDSKLFYEVDELRFVEPSDKIEELEQKIVAKQMALRCLEYGNPMISENPQNPLNRIIPIEKMLEIDIPTLIDKEYKEVSQDFRNEIKESKGKVYNMTKE